MSDGEAGRGGGMEGGRERRGKEEEYKGLSDNIIPAGPDEPARL